MRQYWRDVDSLLKWTRSDPHRQWWQEFLKDSGGTGFWHETYFRRGGWKPSTTMFPSRSASWPSPLSSPPADPCSAPPPAAGKTSTLNPSCQKKTYTTITRRDLSGHGEWILGLLKFDLGESL